MMRNILEMKILLLTTVPMYYVFIINYCSMKINIPTTKNEIKKEGLSERFGPTCGVHLKETRQFIQLMDWFDLLKKRWGKKTLAFLSLSLTLFN